MYSIVCQCTIQGSNVHQHREWKQRLTKEQRNRRRNPVPGSPQPWSKKKEQQRKWNIKCGITGSGIKNEIFFCRKGRKCNIKSYEKGNKKNP